MKHNASSIFNKIANIIFPENYKCICCGKEIITDTPPFVCNKCLNSFSKIENPCKICGTEVVGGGNVCIRCKETKFNFSVCKSCFVYDGEIKNLIFKLKYKNAKYIAKSLATFLFEKLKTLNDKIDYIIPVPICTKRRKLRGYNQTELLAKHLSALSNIPVNSANLIRVKETPSQTSSAFQERLNNLENAFAVCDKNLFKNKTLLILDDVITTGTTLNECAKALRKCKPKDIVCLTVANTTKKIKFENQT